MPNKADYAKISIACKALGLDRLQLLADRYGIDSMKELTDAKLADLYRHFAALGWTPTGRKKRKDMDTTRPGYIHIKPGAAAKQQKKVLAIWKKLGYEVETIHARVKKQFGVERFEWLTDHGHLHTLITDLDARLARQKRGARK